MPLPRLVAMTTLAMLAFAGNSLLCRAALSGTTIDAASFTTIRLVSGALMLALLVHLRGGQRGYGGSWGSACALFVYAAGFSYAYVSLSAATGALLLFGAVQATMIGYGLARGERLRMAQICGLVLALGGLLGLLLPGIARPPLLAASTMLTAGIAWGIYSLRGRGSISAIGATAGNFLRTIPIALAMSLLVHESARMDSLGITYALASGALASGCGYAIWYAVLPSLKASHAATVQLGVPVLAAIAGVVLLGEPLSVRLVLAALAILGGIALVLFKGAR